jgi:hypothetical protein
MIFLKICKVNWEKVNNSCRILKNNICKIGQDICLPVILLLAFAFATACSSTQSRYVMLGKEYPSRGNQCNIEIFRTGSPSKKYIRISRLDVHLEKSFFSPLDYDNALPELKKQACRSGADAVVDIKERSSSIGETRVFHVTATGIKYEE